MSDLFNSTDVWCITQPIQALAKDKFAGYYSFEWEKMWHPEIAEPEVAIPHYAKAVMGYFN